MNWTLAIAIGVALVIFLVWKRMSFVPAEVAKKLLREGVLVIDVRSAAEFGSGHVVNALNIPLGELRERLPRHVKEKSQVLLLHCLSGGRSAIAKQQIKSMGYPNVFNLGSLARAKQIAKDAAAERADIPASCG